MTRECRKCGEIIPNRIIIDGKYSNLQNRKFCLKCSSYKGKNTSPNDPVIRKARVWKKYSEKQKDAVKLCLYKRALQVREELYQKHGGKCIVCGYDKCKRAMSFHHRNPEDKLFGLSLNHLWSKNRELVEKEADKCDLMCLNCHAELEDKIARETSIVKKVNEKYGTNY
jgi:hypothetical protein